METKLQIKLTSTELAALWTTYINDTMAKCVLSYFLHTVEDLEVKKVIESALQFSMNHMKILDNLFMTEGVPVPEGFSDNDVNLNAKRLFSDSFFMFYLKNISKVGLATFGMAYTMTSRSDVRKFFHDCILEAISLDEIVTEGMLSKGINIRPPFLSYSDHIEFVSDKSFLSGGFFGFGSKRPLLSIEIGHLFANVLTNSLGKALLMGFSQVVRSDDIREYLISGKDISSKHMKIFSDILINEDIPSPMSWDTDVMDSTEAPFSDKLILFHISILVAAGTANYGVSAAASPRKDLATNYVRLAAEVATYAEEGALLMIKNGWLEEPPQAPDRDALTSKS